MIRGMLDHGALPVLERLVQFTGQRHKVLSNNIANLSTPYFKPTDLDPRGFQQTLADAIEKRRSRISPLDGPLPVRDSRQVKFAAAGIEARPEAVNENILFHDQNNRDLDRMMQRLAENTLTHNTAVELLRNQFEQLRTAIRARL